MQPVSLLAARPREDGQPARLLAIQGQERVPARSEVVLAARDERLEVLDVLVLVSVVLVDEVVEVILFAADPKNGFMTGQALACDGGITAI